MLFLYCLRITIVPEVRLTQRKRAGTRACLQLFPKGRTIPTRD